MYHPFLERTMSTSMLAVSVRFNEIKNEISKKILHLNINTQNVFL